MLLARFLSSFIKYSCFSFPCAFLFLSLSIIYRMTRTFALIHLCRYARTTTFESTLNEQTNEETYDCVKLQSVCGLFVGGSISR